VDLNQRLTRITPMRRPMIDGSRNGTLAGICSIASRLRRKPKCSVPSTGTRFLRPVRIIGREQPVDRGRRADSADPNDPPTAPLRRRSNRCNQIEFRFRHRSGIRSTAPLPALFQSALRGKQSVTSSCFSFEAPSKHSIASKHYRPTSTSESPGSPSAHLLRERDSVWDCWRVLPPAAAAHFPHRP